MAVHQAKAITLERGHHRLNRYWVPGINPGTTDGGKPGPGKQGERVFALCRSKPSAQRTARPTRGVERRDRERENSRALWRAYAEVSPSARAWEIGRFAPAFSISERPVGAGAGNRSGEPISGPNAPSPSEGPSNKRRERQKTRERQINLPFRNRSASAP